MSCHICQAEAVSRCYNCGELVCDEHGGKDDLCTHCSGGYMSGDPRGGHVSAKPLKQERQTSWWRPQQAEEYVPPSCYECQALARSVCRNCQCRYCREHAGPNGLCRDCGRSANLGLYVFGAIAALMLVLYVFHWLFH